MSAGNKLLWQGLAAGIAGLIVTADIKAGIEKHIAEQVAKGDGYFRVMFEGQELKLNLVRVHVEYLASLAESGTRGKRLDAVFGELSSRGNDLVRRLWAGLEAIPGARLYGPPPGTARTHTWRGAAGSATSKLRSESPPAT